jgi:hypothetical protein
MEKKNRMLVNKYIKLKNPTLSHRNSINHECDSENFEFKTQQENYDKLKESLAEYGIVLSKIYATRWSSYDDINNPNRYVFVVESNSPVVWYKYEGNSVGSGQNYLYLGKKKIKLTQWLLTTKTTRDQFINEMRDNEI